MCLSGYRHWLVTLLLAASLSGPATAAETELVPFVELRQEYTDNLFYSTTGQIDTFITRFTPGVKAAARTELLSGSLAARLSALHYSADSNMDDVEQVYEGNGGCRLTPHLRLSGSAAYRKESWPDREIEISGQALNLTSWHQNYNVGVDYQISQLTTGSLGYGNEQITYNNHTSFSSVISHNVGATLEHDGGRWVPLLKLRGAGRYSRSDYETAQIENFVVTAGASRQVHELWTVSADAGGRYTRSGFQDSNPLLGTRNEASNSLGWVLKSSVDYMGETMLGSLAYSRDVSNSSGRFGTAVEREAVTLSLRKRLSQELSGVLGGGYYRNMAAKNQFGGQGIDETSLRGSFSLRYEFSRNVIADLGYEYFRLENSGTASRSKVFFQLTAQTRFFE